MRRRWHIDIQAEISNWNNVDPMLDTNFRLSTDSRNDNDVLCWYNTNFQRCINTGNQHIFNAGCQHFENTGYILLLLNNWQMPILNRLSSILQ